MSVKFGQTWPSDLIWLLYILLLWLLYIHNSKSNFLNFTLFMCNYVKDMLLWYGERRNINASSSISDSSQQNLGFPTCYLGEQRTAVTLSPYLSLCLKVPVQCRTVFQPLQPQRLCHLHSSVAQAPGSGRKSSRRLARLVSERVLRASPSGGSSFPGFWGFGLKGCSLGSPQSCWRLQLQPTGSLVLYKTESTQNNNSTQINNHVAKFWKVTAVLPTRNILKVFHAAVHYFTGLIDIALKLLRVNVRQRVIEPTFSPSQPFRGGDEQVFKWLKVLYQLLHMIILSHTKKNDIFMFFIRNYLLKLLNHIKILLSDGRSLTYVCDICTKLTFSGVVFLG